MTLSCNNCEFFNLVEKRSRGRCSSPSIVDSYGKDKDLYPGVDQDGWCPVYKLVDDKND